MAEEKRIATGYIGNALRSSAADHTTTFADEVFDTERQKYQSEVNTDIEGRIEAEAEARANADEQLNTAIEAEKERAKAAEEANTQAIAKRGIFDVSAHNNDAVFESLQALLSSSNLNTLIPTSVRHGGMSIRFIQGSEQSSDNKYIQARCMAQNFTTDVTQWQGVDDEPTAGSDNLVKSRGVKASFIENPSFFTNAVVNNKNLNHFFKELYITGLDSGTDYCLRTLRRYTYNTKEYIQINIGTSSSSVIQLDTEVGENYIFAKSGNISAYAVLQDISDIIVGNTIIGNVDTTICSLNKAVCNDLLNSPYIKSVILDAQVNGILSDMNVLKEMYVIGGNSTYRVYVKKKTNDYLYCRIIDSSDNMVCASDYYIPNLPPVLKVAEINLSGVTAYIVIDYNYVPYDDNNYYTYSYAGNYRLLGDNPSVNTYLNVTPKLDCSSLIGNFFSNSIVGNIELKQFFKELYIKGLDASTSYCLRTLRNTGSGFQINIGTSSASVLQIDISAGNIYGYAKSGNIEAHVVLQNTDKIVGSLIFGNTDTTICSINKNTCADLANSPYIADIVNDGYVVPASFNGYPLPKKPVTLKILSIGNSFVDHPMTKLKYWLDAIGITQVYYGKVSKSGGTLQQHLAGLNTIYDANFAISESNGTTQNNWKFVDPATGQDGEVQIKLSDALKFTDWDIITFQQASGDSGRMNTITPYLPSLIQAARYYCPNAGVKIGWHQTWVFAAGYDDLSIYSNSQDIMFSDIVDVSKQIYQEYGLDLIIPNAIVMQHLRSIPNSYWGADLLTIKGYDTYTQEHQNADFCIDGKHPNYFAEFCLCASFVQMLINCCFNKTILGEGGDAGIWKDDYIITGVQCVLKAVGNRFSLSQITT